MVFLDSIFQLILNILYALVADSIFISLFWIAIISITLLLTLKIFRGFGHG